MTYMPLKSFSSRDTLAYGVKLSNLYLIPLELPYNVRTARISLIVPIRAYIYKGQNERARMVNLTTPKCQ